MKLSICIPTYRRAEFLRIALMHWGPEIAAAEGRAELIVGDNEASPAVRALVEEEARATNTTAIRYVGHPENLQFNGNVLSLVRDHAAGEFAWVCGDDDFVHRGALAKVLDALDRHRDLDYLYVNQRRIDAEHCTPEELAEAETSAKAALENADRTDRRMAEAAEIVPLDRSCFTGVYASIWRREEAVRAFEGTESDPAFTSVRGTFPHACHVARHLLRKPCYYFGEPLLTVSHAVSYGRFGATLSLIWLPGFYDLLEREGVPRRQLDPYRRRLVRRSGRRLARLLRERRAGAPHARHFSLLRFIAANARFPELYPSLAALPFEKKDGQKPSLP